MHSIIDSVKDLSYTLISNLQNCICKTDTTLKLNGRSFKILKLLGEGGFSYVYLAEDLTSSRLFALKKIRCPLGSDSVKNALKEVEAYKRFKHPNIIRILDSCVQQDLEDPEAKIIYLFLPFYKLSVQDVIALHSINGTYYSETTILEIFLGTCEAVSAMHHYISGPAASSSSSAHYPPSPSTSTSTSTSNPISTNTRNQSDHEEEENGLTGGEEEGEGVALINRLDGNGDAVDVDDLAEELGILEMSGGNASSSNLKGGGEIKIKDGTPLPWAHRDIKPANIMLTDLDSSSSTPIPILMDFGSALPARIEIPNRSKALLEQDLAAETCSMPFRAPELFDVKTGTPLTEAVDIWSLGCTLYCMAYHTSPFETIQQSEHGGSIAMAALNGKFTFPNDGRGGYSEGFKELVRGCLVVKVEGRLKIDEVIERTKTLLESNRK